MIDYSPYNLTYEHITIGCGRHLVGYSHRRVGANPSENMNDSLIDRRVKTQCFSAAGHRNS